MGNKWENLRKVGNIVGKKSWNHGESLKENDKWDIISGIIWRARDVEMQSRPAVMIFGGT